MPRPITYFRVDDDYRLRDSNGRYISHDSAWDMYRNAWLARAMDYPDTYWVTNLGDFCWYLRCPGDQVDMPAAPVDSSERPSRMSAVARSYVEQRMAERGPVQPAPDLPRLETAYPATYCQTSQYRFIFPPSAPEFSQGEMRDELNLRWVPHPSSSYDSDYCFMIHPYDDASPPLTRMPLGPSRFDCRRGCTHADGCATCNPSEWDVCHEGCSGEERYRRPVGQEECRCWVTCGDCDRFTPPSETQYIRGVRRCDECAENWSYCDDCSDWFDPDDYSGHDCPYRCCDECDGSERHIHSYSYKPDPYFFRIGDDDGPVYMGMELEINTSDSAVPVNRLATHSQRILGDMAYLKSDSSIGTGFELVTHPMTLRYAMERFPWHLLSELSAKGVTESPLCGLHVHLNRDGFANPAHVYRWLKFIHRNRDAVTRVARRDSDQWAPFRVQDRAWAVHLAKAGARAADVTSFQTRVPAGYDVYGYRKYSYRHKWYCNSAKMDQYGSPSDVACDRYTAINVTNYYTFEMRIFASSLNPVEVQAALQLAHGSVEYTRTLTATDILKRDGWSFSAFTDWARERGGYAALVSEIERLVH